MSAPVSGSKPIRSTGSRRRALLALAAALLMLAVLLGACEDRRNGAPPATTSPVSPNAAAAPSASETGAVAPVVIEASSPTSMPAPTTSAAASEPAPAAATLADGTTLTATLAVTSPAPASPAAGATAVVAAPVCTIETSPELAGFSRLEEGLGCPSAEGGVETVAINEFGSGPDYDRFMLWFAGEQQIYVLKPGGDWLAYTDTWTDAEPEILCNPLNLDPPASPPLPRRGFGKLWCTVPSVQAAMGAIDREERQCQHAVVQRFEQGRLLACFEDATIRYFRLLEDGTWDMEMVQ